MESSSLINAPKPKFLVPKRLPPRLILDSKEPNIPQGFLKLTPQKQQQNLNHSFLSNMSTNSKDSFTEEEFDTEEELNFPVTTIFSLLSNGK